MFYLFPADLEIGAVACGLVVSSLVGLVYLAPPLTAVLARSARSRRLVKRLQMPAVAVLFGALAAVGLITVLAGPAVVMMAATSTIVLASLIASALFASKVILRMTGRAERDAASENTGYAECSNGLMLALFQPRNFFNTEAGRH